VVGRGPENHRELTDPTNCSGILESTFRPGPHAGRRSARIQSGRPCFTSRTRLRR
jgi:hypothetical protein